MPATGVTRVCKPPSCSAISAFSESSILPLRFTFMPGASDTSAMPSDNATSDWSL